MRKRIAVLLAVAMMASVTAGCSGAEAKAPAAGTETSGGQTGENASQGGGGIRGESHPDRRGSSHHGQQRGVR